MWSWLEPLPNNNSKPWKKPMNYLVVCKPSLSLSALLIIKYPGIPVLGFYYYLTNYNKVRAIKPLSKLSVGQEFKHGLAGFLVQILKRLHSSWGSGLKSYLEAQLWKGLLPICLSTSVKLICCGYRIHSCLLLQSQQKRERDSGMCNKTV